MARGGARPGAGRPAGKSANTSPPSARARARARDGGGNQRPWPADKVERWGIERLIPYAKNARVHTDAQGRRDSRQHFTILGAKLSVGVNGNAAEPVALVLQRYEQAPLPEAFAVQLVQRLRDQDPDVVPALMWLEGRLTAQGNDGRRDRAYLHRSSLCCTASGRLCRAGIGRTAWPNLWSIGREPVASARELLERLWRC